MLELIQADAPSIVVEELLLDSEIVVLKEALSMAIFKNDADTLSLLVPYSLDIEAFTVDDFFTSDIFPTQVNDDILMILNERKVIIGAK
jgi:hypothetical protein